MAGTVFNCLLRPARTPRVSIGGVAQKWTAAASQTPPTCRAATLSTPAAAIRRAGAARRPISTSRPRRARQAADEPGFTSVLDNPPELVRSGRRHGPGLIILAIIPVTAFILGTWQVKRLEWKTELIAKCEDRLVRAPLPLPPRIDADAIPDFDYRRVWTTGRYRHDQEMLIGPRMRDGEQGYMVVTPLEREGGPETTVLVNRGWISKDKADKRKRMDSLKPETVRVEGMLREPWKKNMFTPDNNIEKGEFYFPDVHQMAQLTGSQPVWIEQTMDPDILQLYDYVARGIPIGRPAEVNLRNNHAQYIFTWYGLAVATSIMFWLVVKKPPSDITRRVRMNKSW
ncbi:SURF1 family-domain-containing protein [Lasiosphaeria miniovina]|uniref:SURF1-like protein n=1 Tax=Lasiosphaeria miniovina TaxID=1954250 RepID=A0AA40AJL2_9PEZI|nr:SURF1 family-domain-containing protein [Lasiosphaeria miniovina]KAK0717061.1 SURF1 family-domain-containing protein [Lasiosphaeria miniovina]